jgi:DNA-binding HxlR family transcriptional regulator
MKKDRERPTYTADAAAAGIDDSLRILEGRWKMKILFHLFDKGTLRFSELERHVSGVSQKMLIQQLKELERDGIVARTVYPVVPPKVDYRLTEIGQDLCPVLDAILEWAERRAPNAEHP